jgi:putative NADH-flavin reductase
MMGQRIVREALDRGHHVTVIVRDPSRVDAAHERLQLRQGDVLDKAQISRLIAGPLPGQRTGVFRLGDDTLIVNDKGESRITMEDYAVAIVNEAENPQHVGRRFTVGY